MGGWNGSIALLLSFINGRRYDPPPFLYPFAAFRLWVGRRVHPATQPQQRPAAAGRTPPPRGWAAQAGSAPPLAVGLCAAWVGTRRPGRGAPGARSPIGGGCVPIGSGGARCGREQTAARDQCRGAARQTQAPRRGRKCRRRDRASSPTGGAGCGWDVTSNRRRGARWTADNFPFFRKVVEVRQLFVKVRFYEIVLELFVKADFYESETVVAQRARRPRTFGGGRLSPHPSISSHRAVSCRFSSPPLDHSPIPIKKPP